MNMSMKSTRSTIRPLRFSAFSRMQPLGPTALRTPLKNIRKLMDIGEVDCAALAIEALSEQAPYDIRVLALSAECMAAKGDHEQAVKINDRLLNQQDSDVVWAAKARSLVALGRYRRASLCFARASTLARSSRFASEHAECLLAAGKLSDALSILESAQSGPDSNERQRIVHASVLFELGRNNEAFALALQAAENDTTGRAIYLANRTKPSKTSLEGICANSAMKHTSPDVMSEISRTFPEKISEAKVTQLMQISSGPDCAEATSAHLALFRIYDSRGDAFQALAHLRRFHALSTQQAQFRPGQFSSLFTALTRLDFNPLSPSKALVLPIFVTGLPGTGLEKAASVLEQAAGVGPARPLSIVPAVMNRLIRKLKAKKSNMVSREDMLTLQSELRTGLQQAAQNSDVIIDTNAANFRWSGLLAAVLPEARIVHMKGNHLASGWALHTGNLSDPAFGCQHDLHHIQTFMHRSATLMAHWEASFSPNVMAISDDALSRPNSATAQAMIEACTLKWSERCMPCPSSPDPSWRRYAAYLNPLRQSEEPLAKIASTRSIM